MEFFDALASQSFLRYALLAGLLASVGCGIMGTYVVVKKLNFLAGGIAHSVLGGMGVAYFFGNNPLYGALITSIIAALLIGWVKLKCQEDEDIMIAALWSVGMAIGILFISKTPGYSIDLMSYLFGNILMVSEREILLMAVLNLGMVVTVIIFFQQFLAVCFDEEFARIRGVNVEFYYLLLLCMVALTVVLLIQVVGLILVIALLTLPAAIAAKFRHSIRQIMLMAVLLGAVFSVGGLVISYQLNLPSGATIILVAGLTYLLLTIVGRIRRSTA